jgi:hypothetical protein
MRYTRFINWLQSHIPPAMNFDPSFRDVLLEQRAGVHEHYSQRSCLHVRIAVRALVVLGRARLFPVLGEGWLDHFNGEASNFLYGPQQVRPNRRRRNGSDFR